MTVEDLENFRVGDAVEAAVCEDGANGLAIGAGAALERMDDGEGGFAFAEVGGDGFAEDIFGGGEVEDVIDDLEGEAEVAAVLAHAEFDAGGRVSVEFLGFGALAEGRAELHGDLEEAGGLAINEVEVLLLVDEVAELLDLEQLALDHLLGERDEEIEDVEVSFFERGGEGLHVEPVAGEDALGVAPGGVGGGAAATNVGLVDDVVVNEGGGVEHFNDGAEADAAGGGGGRVAAEGLGREQEEHGADAFAAAGHEVGGDIGDDLDVRGGLGGELELDRVEVVPKEVEDLFRARDGESTHFLE